MKLIKDLLYGVSIVSVSGNTSELVSGIAYDSRKVTDAYLFVAIKGLQSDGHDFIDKAIASGATAVVCQYMPSLTTEGVNYIVVSDTQAALAILASNWYDQPSKSISLVGVTGTNGKTTVSSLLHQLFSRAGYPCGLISTIKILVGTDAHPTTHTTPDPLVINSYLQQMVLAGMSYCFMEVSSHGIAQKRIQGLQFKGAIFTNLSQDHLDYHKTFAGYRDTKKLLFDGLSKQAFAITNSDDKNGLFMLQNSAAKKYSYGLKSLADFKAQILENQFSGQLIKINQQELWTSLLGEFNAYNLLAIYAAATLLGLEDLEVLEHLSALENVAGRFQYVVSKEGITAIVDYAHTPDALANILDTIERIRTKNERLITVVGCGGDRDQGKRPLMGGIAAEKSDTIIFTSDNPRSENPSVIIEQMEAGVSASDIKKILVIENRKQAIKTACQLAGPKDIILIAGKGHEDFQEINGVRTPFSDFEIVKEHLTLLQE
mgnify:CR=1 FL=1